SRNKLVKQLDFERRYPSSSIDEGRRINEALETQLVQIDKQIAALLPPLPPLPDHRNPPRGNPDGEVRSVSPEEAAWKDEQKRIHEQYVLRNDFRMYIVGDLIPAFGMLGAKGAPIEPVYNVRGPLGLVQVPRAPNTLGSSPSPETPPVAPKRNVSL